MNFSKKIFLDAHNKKRPMIIDGAMGSLLQQNGVSAHSKLWMSKANIDSPEIVEKIHKDYINAGADIITSNTFRTNPAAVNNSMFASEELVNASLQIAKQARGNSDVIIAGSNPPAEDCYQKDRYLIKNDLEMNHKTHIDLLLKYGSDFILNETQSHLDEIKIICEYCFNNKINYVLSLFVDEYMKILSGEDVSDVIKFILNYEPIAIAFNCSTISAFLEFYKANELNFNWGMYLNCGDGSFRNTDIACGVSPKKYVEIVRNILPKKPIFIGACCGSSQAHIKKIKELLDA